MDCLAHPVPRVINQHWVHKSPGVTQIIPQVPNSQTVQAKIQQLKTQGTRSPANPLNFVVSNKRLQKSNQLCKSNTQIPSPIHYHAKVQPLILKDASSKYHDPWPINTDHPNSRHIQAIAIVVPGQLNASGQACTRSTALHSRPTYQPVVPLL